jgi:hypothetical protein
MRKREEVIEGPYWENIRIKEDDFGELSETKYM